MKLAGQLKHIAFAFLLAMLVYAVAFYVLERNRTRNGPWQVAFVAAAGTSPPSLIINEPKLRISDMRIVFPRRSTPPTNSVMVFEQPREVPFEVPYGKCVFMDAMSLPGTVAFVLFGHEIQLLPRTLTVDKKEYDWRSITNLEVIP